MSKKKRKIVGEVELNLDKIRRSENVEKHALSLLSKHDRALYRLNQINNTLKGITGNYPTASQNLTMPMKLSDVFDTVATLKQPFFEYKLAISRFQKIGETFRHIREIGKTLQSLQDIGKAAKRLFTTDELLELEQRIIAFLNTIEMLKEPIEKEYRSHPLYDTFHEYLLNLGELVSFTYHDFDRYKKPRYVKFSYFLKYLKEANLNHISQNEKGLIYPHLYEMIFYFLQLLADFWNDYDRYQIIKNTDTIQLLLDPNLETLVNTAKKISPFIGDNGKLSNNNLYVSIIYDIARDNNFQESELHPLYCVFAYMLYDGKEARYRFVKFAKQYKRPSLISELFNL